MAQIWTSAPTAVKARERRWSPPGWIPTESRHGSALPCSAPRAGGGRRPSCGIHPPAIALGKVFVFQSPNWKHPSCCDKGLRGGRKIRTMWCFGSTHRLSLLQNVSRGQRAQLCWVEICLLVFLPSSQRHLWTQRTDEAGSAMALGERRPRDRDMTAKSSCIPALPGGRCPCGGRERAGKPGIQWSRACQAASYAGAVCRCASLAHTLLASSGASSPCPWFSAIWVCVVTDCSAQLEHAAPRRTCVSSFSLALLSLATFSYVIFPAPSFTAMSNVWPRN